MKRHDRNGGPAEFYQHVGDGNYKGTDYMFGYSLSSGMPVLSFDDGDKTHLTFEPGDVVPFAASLAGIAPIEAGDEEWYLSSDDEYYLPMRYPSRDAAMNAGVMMYHEVAGGDREYNDLYMDEGIWSASPQFYVGKRMRWWHGVDEDDMLYQAQADADDYAGEFAEGWLDDVSKEDREKLRSMLQAAFDCWIAQTGREPTFFMIEQSEEVDPRMYEVSDGD